MSNVTQSPVLDPVTYEVLRHRLWAINDEQGLLGAQMSGSPIVYEAYDFNSALLSQHGETLFVGVYTTRLSLSIDIAVKTVVKEFAADPGIDDGDMFLTNDPWAAAIHQNDFIVVAPIFHAGRIVCWSGLCMHENDVGGPVPGSFCIGTRDVYGEGPILPPLKVVERGKLRPDIERLFIRNTRTPELNALNLRARIAAINKTRERITEVIDAYGIGAFLAVQEEILADVRRLVRRRLHELPDGVWCEHGYLDHDGNDNELYEVKVAMSKRGDRLTFDFRGTSLQAPGLINCTHTGMWGGVMAAMLTLVLYDMPWATGALYDLVDVISDEGTVNNAAHPAAVSMGTVSAAFMTGNVCMQAVAKMFACSEKYRHEIMALGWPGWMGAIYSGVSQHGRFFAGALMDQGGGGGARSTRDGLDMEGVPGSPKMAISNVETIERLYPILYLYRKLHPETAGAGKFRGGLGLELARLVRKAPAALQLLIIGHGVSQPEARGLMGGLPGSVNANLLVRRTGLDDAGKGRNNRLPGGAEEIDGTDRQVLAAKTNTMVDNGDVLVTYCCGGGGYGDPLERDPYRVADDVALGLCNDEIAARQYGVVFENGSQKPDLVRTAEQREKLRRERLQDSRPVAPTSY